MITERRILIVNADDFNLTSGVSEAILDSHDHGIVSSTTVLINQPFSKTLLKEVKRRKNLGIGLHLNVTLGLPVLPSKKIPSLVQSHGIFKHRHEQLQNFPQSNELDQEWEAQVLSFKKIFGRIPTHLDTHHQLHDHPFFYRTLLRMAKRCGLPVRRSRLMKKKLPVKTTGHFFGDLDPSGYWKKKQLYQCLSNLPQGVSEIMCHPGKNDAALQGISSFTEGREKEWRLLRSKELKKVILEKRIQLSHFGLCYTSTKRPETSYQ